MMKRTPMSLALALITLVAASACKGKDDLYYGDEAAFEGMGKGIDNGTMENGPHDPNEPAKFSAGWVGTEAYEVLQAAKRGDFANGQTRISTGEPCLAFHKDRLVRRMIIGTGRTNEPTQEITFSEAGNMVLWFHSNRAPQPIYSWAYFHRNSRLALYQTKYPGAARQTETPPGILQNQVYAHVNDCLSRFKATNPPAGSAAGAAPPSQPGASPQLQPQPVSGPQPIPQPGIASPAQPQRSEDSRLPVQLKFVNRRAEGVNLIWIDTAGAEKPYGTLGPNQQMDMNTYVRHLWVFRSASTGQEVQRFAATSQTAATVDIY